MLDFLKEDTLIIHNSQFDMGFINNELKLIGLPPLKNPVDVLPGWHKVGYFPNDYTQDDNALTSKEKIMNDILVMGRLDVYVDEGAHETIVLNYQTLGEEVVDYNKRFQAGTWIGFSLFFITIVILCFIYE